MDIQLLLSLMRERKSIRSFLQNKPIPEQAIQQILEAGRLAPSAGNIQTWHFFLIRDNIKKRAIAEAAFGQSFIAQAPLVIVAGIDKKLASLGYGSRGLHLYSIQDTAAAIEHMLLAARALGIGSCWIGAFSEDALENALKIDNRQYRTVAIIPLGYSDEPQKKRGRRSVKSIVTEL